MTTSVLLSSLLIFSCTQQDIPPADNPGTDVDVQIESISILPASATLEKGKTLQLTYEIQPSNIKENGVVWSSSNPSVATVDGNGLVSAVGAGTSDITLAAKQGGKKAVCRITVVEKTESPSIVIKEGTQYVFSCYQGEVQLHTDLSSGALSCQSDRQWCTVRVDSNQRPYVITAEVTPFWEEAAEPRRATLTLSSAGKTLGTFLIIQDPLARLEAPALLSVPAGGGKFRFQVISNVYQVEASAGTPLYSESDYELTNLSQVSSDGHYVIFTIAPWDVTKEKPKPACIRVAAREQVKFVEIAYLDPDVSSDVIPYDNITNWD